jgi:amphi-Trp domain-containing protein
MMMEDFEYASRLAPAAAAARLREIADQLERGALELAGDSITAPDAVALKIELEEIRDGEQTSFELEVEVRWPLPWKSEKETDADRAPEDTEERDEDSAPDGALTRAGAASGASLGRKYAELELDSDMIVIIEEDA